MRIQTTNLIKEIRDVNIAQQEENDIIEFDKEFNKNIKPQQVTELQFHKILYFLYGMFWREFGKELFDANFEAWKYGPVEVDLRSSLKDLTMEPEKFDIKLNKKEKRFIIAGITSLLQFNTWALVKKSHLTEPWINNFDEDDNSKQWKAIDNNQIKDYFDNVDSI